MNASNVSIPNPLYDTISLEAVPLDIIEQRDVLVEQAEQACRSISTVDDFTAANTLLKRVKSFRVMIEKSRKEMKKPLLDLEDLLDAAAKEAMQPVLYVEGLLNTAVKTFADAENERRAAEARLREQEQRRLQAEEDARAAAARQKAQEDAAANTLPDEEPEPVPVTQDLPRKITIAPAPAPLKAAVKVSYDYQVDIDPTQLPREIGGQPLWIPNREMIEKMAKLGMTIPGVTVTKTERLGTKVR